MEYTIEKEWTTKVGLRAVCLANDVGGGMFFRCGYVEVLKEHPLFGLHHDNGQLGEACVCRGLTFSDDHIGRGEQSDGWWFGFDCAHVNDGLTKETARSMDYVVEECERLAKQLAMKPPEDYDYQ